MEHLKSDNATLESRVKELTEDKTTLEKTVSTSLSEEESRKELIAKWQLENKELNQKIANYQDVLARTVRADLFFVLSSYDYIRRPAASPI